MKNKTTILSEVPFKLAGYSGLKIDSIKNNIHGLYSIAVIGNSILEVVYSNSSKQDYSDYIHDVYNIINTIKFDNTKGLELPNLNSNNIASSLYSDNFHNSSVNTSTISHDT